MERSTSEPSVSGPPRDASALAGPAVASASNAHPALRAVRIPGTAGGDAAGGDGAGGDEPCAHAADFDGPSSWTASGPFRAAPMGYVMHATPPGTPLASPRHSGGDDLEAPLLPRDGGDKVAQQASGAGSSAQAITFGLINVAAGVPALIAFCAVVFKDPIYEPWLEPLCKFFFLASAIHQAVVCVRSDVPYAVGQVQDVGLLFLSAMASSIAAACGAAGLDAAAALATALTTMAASTLLVGMGLICVARARLASAVQYLPLPAVGGYLAYVGYFCFASGLGLGCGVPLGSPASWAALADARVAARCLPTLASTAALMATMARCKHPAALPAVLLAIVAAFHGVLLAAGVSLEQAQAAGWVLKPAASSGQFWTLWRMFGRLEDVQWRAAAAQVGKLAGLFLLVTFGSSMDIAAIQADTPFRLDFNRELTTIGLSNMLTGAIGCGFTGSFIFSQTIFSGRAGVRSRLNGAVIAAAEFAMFAAPVTFVQWLPCFWFGSLLVWFGVEIMADWLARSYRRLSGAEYSLLLATFCAIMAAGLEAGIAAGCVLSMAFFVYAYAQSQLSAFSLVAGRSGIVRPADAQAALELLRPGHLATAQLRGFLFFGCASALSARLHRAAQQLERAGEAGGGGAAPPAPPSLAASPWRPRGPQPSGADRLYGGGSRHGGALRAAAAAPKLFLLDFSRVKGLDATAARTLGALFRDLAQLDITPVVTAVPPAVRALLAAHGVPLPPQPAARAADATPFTLRSAAGAPAAPHLHEFLSYEEGLRYAEQQLLAVAARFALCRAPSQAVTLQQALASHAGQAGLPFAGREAAAAAAAAVAARCDVLLFRPGDVLWAEGQPADAFFVVEQGRVVVEQAVAPGGGGAPPAPPSSEASDGGGGAEGGERPGGGGGGGVRVFEFGPGCIAGVVDLWLRRTRSSTATVADGGGGSGGGACRVLRVSREALGRLAEEEPAALHVLQAAVLRAKCLDLGVAAELAAARV